MRNRILVTGPLLGHALELLSSRFKVEVSKERGMSREEVLEKVSDKVALLTANVVPVDEELMKRAPNLKVVSTVSVGYDHIDVEAATKLGIYVLNTPDVSTQCVVETTWGLILSAFKRLAEFDRYVRRGKWDRGIQVNQFLGHDLYGKVLGVIGFGRIGRRVADLAPAFGMRAVYYDPVKPPYGLAGVTQYRELDELLSESDVITIHVNYNKGVYHLINDETISKIKRGAVLVNTSRGDVVEEKALVRALREGIISAAALDVFEKEPLPADSELLTFENVVLSPHRGSSSEETRVAMSEYAAENLISLFSGMIPSVLVNKEVLQYRPLSDLKIQRGNAGGGVRTHVAIRSGS